MPNIRIKNTAPNVTAKSAIPNIRVHSGGSVTTINSGGVPFGGQGYLIGMLGLTYITSQSTPIVSTTLVSDIKPNIRIKNG